MSRIRNVIEALKGMHTVAREAEWRAWEETGDRLDRLEKFMKSQTDFKEEIRDHVNKARAVDNRVAKDIHEWTEATGVVIAEIQARVGAVHQGLLHAERKINAVWNTLNTTVEWIVNVFTGAVPMPTHTLSEQQLDGTWARDTRLRFSLTREAIGAAIKEAGEALYARSAAHERAEMERMKAEKAKGGTVLPMRPRPTITVAESAIEHADELIIRYGKEVASKRDGEES